MRDATGFRQQLSTTSFEAFELEITENYPVHTWISRVDRCLFGLSTWL